MPAIAQLVEHLTVDFAGIRGSLVRFRVAGLLLSSQLLLVERGLRTVSTACVLAGTEFFPMCVRVCVCVFQGGGR